MHTFDDVDADLFGLPATDLAYDGGTRPDCWEEGRVEMATVLLDMKADTGGDPLDEMQTMLSEMTKELRERFQRFQGQRRTRSTWRMRPKTKRTASSPRRTRRRRSRLFR